MIDRDVAITVCLMAAHDVYPEGYAGKCTEEVRQGAAAVLLVLANEPEAATELAHAVELDRYGDWHVRLHEGDFGPTSPGLYYEPSEIRRLQDAAVA